MYVVETSDLFHRVIVTFNVNNSIPPNMEEEPEQGQKAEENEVKTFSPPLTFMALTDYF